jgi:hypothetical protein
LLPIIGFQSGRMAERVISRSAMSGDHHFAAGHPTHFKLSKNVADHRLTIRPSEYHVLQKIVIRWTNKNAPPSQKFSYRVNRFKSCVNIWEMSPKCTNSIKHFENSAL